MKRKPGATYRGNKRSKGERAKDLNVIADLWRRGWSIREIGAHLNISPNTAWHDVQVIDKEWQAYRVNQTDLHKNRQAAQIDMLKRELLEEWEKSKQAKTKHSQETVRKPRSGKGKKKNAPDETAQVKVMASQEHQHGDPALANALIKLLEREARLHGLDAPRRTELTGEDGGPIQLIDPQFAEQLENAFRKKHG